jgi:hypothetical protein
VTSPPRPSAADADAAKKADADAAKKDEETAKKDEETAKEAEPSGRPGSGTVVSFVFRDPLTGDQLSGIGVVLGDSDTGSVTVRPLADYNIEVDPAVVELVVV